jgi:uncharacterized membrane protein
MPRPVLILLLAAHVLAAFFWVGGMAFAYFMLRPAAGALEPAVRLPLWRRVFQRFFPWVGLAIAALLVSGYAIILFQLGGFRGLPLHINVMQGIGILMMLIFGHLYFAPWRRFQAALDAGALPQAGAQLNQIRMIVATNLTLGVITVLVGATGRYW